MLQIDGRVHNHLPVTALVLFGLVGYCSERKENQQSVLWGMMLHLIPTLAVEWASAVGGSTAFNMRGMMQKSAGAGIMTFHVMPGMFWR